LFEGIKKSLEPTKNMYYIFSNLEKFKNMKVKNIKINNLKTLYQFYHSKNWIIFIGQHYNKEDKKCQRLNYCFRGIGICCE